MTLLRQAARLHALFVLALPCVVGVLLLYGVYDHLRMRNYREAVMVLGIACLFFAPVILVATAEISQRRFIRWVGQNVDQIADGEAVYRGARISAATEVVVFHVAFSVLVASFRIPSQMFVVGHDRLWFWRIIYSLLTFVFGWWGIPWGPVYTIKSLHDNLRTSTRGPLLDMLAMEGWHGGGGSVGGLAPKS
jgi:hypothetical protein